MRPTLLLLVLLLAGCSGVGGDDATVQRSELPRTVLQPQDLPDVFMQFDHGHQIGRVNGWKARYRRPGSFTTPGPLVIESRSQLFESVEGAKAEFGAAGESLRASEDGWQPIDEPGLGDESYAATVVDGGVRYYQVVWRNNNAIARLNVNGFEGKLALADALELARKQQRRIARVAG